MMIVGCEWRQHWGVERKCVLAVAVAQCVRDAMFMLAALLTLLAASMDLDFGLASRHYEYLSSTCRGGDGVTGGSRFDEKKYLTGCTSVWSPLCIQTHTGTVYRVPVN